MKLFDWIKRKRTPDAVDTSFTAEEAELAPGIAELAGTVMRLQLSTASHYTMTYGHDLKDFMWEIQAFAFGLLCSALEQKGIAWYKLVPILVPYCKSYMPDYPDPQELAQLVSHFGMKPEYAKYAAAGHAAMVRFANSTQDNPTHKDINDLAAALGVDRESET